MLKREITYKDLDDQEVKETFYFNLTKTEILDMELEHGQGGLDAWIRRIVRTDDHAGLVAEFKKIILASYGERSPDGKKFIKSDELKRDFAQSMAYDQLFFELATSDEKASEFLIAILPAEIQEEAKRLAGLPQPNIQPAENLRRTETVELSQPTMAPPAPPATEPMPNDGTGGKLGGW